MDTEAPVVVNPQKTAEERQHEETLKAARRRKHIHLDKILDTANFLSKIFNNVHKNPTEEKYRKIRLNNNAFNTHVRNAPGAEEFMLTGGWKPTVVDFERYFVFEHQPGTMGWEILEIACGELAKLKALIEAKLRRGDSGERKAQKQKELEAVRHALEEDRQDRQLKYAGGV